MASKDSGAYATSAASLSGSAVVEWKYGGYFGTVNVIDRKLILPTDSEPGSLVSVQWGLKKLKALLIEYMDDEDAEETFNQPKRKKATAHERAAPPPTPTPSPNVDIDKIFSLLSEIKSNQTAIKERLDALDTKCDALDSKHNAFSAEIRKEVGTIKERVTTANNNGGLNKKVDDVTKTVNLISGVSQKVLSRAEKTHNILYRRIMDDECSPAPQDVSSSPVSGPSSSTPVNQVYSTPQNIASITQTPHRPVHVTTHAIDYVPNVTPATVSIPALTANLSQKDASDARLSVAKGQVALMEVNDDNQLVLCSEPNVCFPIENYLKLVESYADPNRFGLNLVRDVFAYANIPFHRYSFNGAYQKLSLKKDPVYQKLLELIRQIYPDYVPNAHSFTEACKRLEQAVQKSEQALQMSG